MEEKILQIAHCVLKGSFLGFDSQDLNLVRVSYTELVVGKRISQKLGGMWDFGQEFIGESDSVARITLEEVPEKLYFRCVKCSL